MAIMIPAKEYIQRIKAEMTTLEQKLANVDATTAYICPHCEEVYSKDVIAERERRGSSWAVTLCYCDFED